MGVPASLSPSDGHHFQRANMLSAKKIPSSLVQFSSVTQLCLTLCIHGLQHTRLLCPSPTPGSCSNACPRSQWCHPTFSSSVIPFSSFLQSFPASGSFPMSRLLASGGQSIGASGSPSSCRKQTFPYRLLKEKLQLSCSDEIIFFNANELSPIK